MSGRKESNYGNSVVVVMVVVVMVVVVMAVVVMAVVVMVVILVEVVLRGIKQKPSKMPSNCQMFIPGLRNGSHYF